MFDIGFPELMLSVVVGLLVIGPERLPGAMRTLGLWLGRMRRSFQSVKAEIEKEIGMDEVRKQLHNEAVMEEMKRIEKEVKETASAANEAARIGSLDPPTSATEAAAPDSPPDPGTGNPAPQTIQPSESLSHPSQNPTQAADPPVSSGSSEGVTDPSQSPTQAAEWPVSTSYAAPQTKQPSESATHPPQSPTQVADPPVSSGSSEGVTDPSQSPTQAAEWPVSTSYAAPQTKQPSESATHPPQSPTQVADPPVSSGSSEGVTDPPQSPTASPLADGEPRSPLHGPPAPNHRTPAASRSANAGTG